MDTVQDPNDVDPRLLAPWLPAVTEKLPSCFRFLLQQPFPCLAYDHSYSLGSRKKGSITDLQMEKHGIVLRQESSKSKVSGHKAEKLPHKIPVLLALIVKPLISCAEQCHDSLEDLKKERPVNICLRYPQYIRTFLPSPYHSKNTNYTTFSTFQLSAEVHRKH